MMDSDEKEEWRKKNETIHSRYRTNERHRNDK